jgi:hypothetical protein
MRLFARENMPAFRPLRRSFYGLSCRWGGSATSSKHRRDGSSNSLDGLLSVLYLRRVTAKPMRAHANLSLSSRRENPENCWRKNENGLLIDLQDDCLSTSIAQPLSARKTK